MPTSLRVGEGAQTVYEFDHGLPKLEHEWSKTEAHKTAGRRGAEGKITLRVVDSTGAPVPDASVEAWFWRTYDDGTEVNRQTDSDRLVALGGTSVADMHFTIRKEGHYTTHLRYWFSKRGYDCVKDGRWQPWNPVLAVTLKDIRMPIQLTHKNTEILFPANTDTGFDFIIGDWIEPYGRGVFADAAFHISGVALDGRVFHYTNVLSFVEGSGFVPSMPDTFSQLKSDYLAPENGYLPSMIFLYDYDGTHEGSKESSQREKILYFKVGRQIDRPVRYGKLVGGVIGGLAYPDTNTAYLGFSYYINPNDGDRNLEYEDTYEFRNILNTPHLDVAQKGDME